MAWQFGKHEEPSHWRVDGLILVVQPTIENLQHMRRVRYARMKARRAEVERQAREAIERQERDQRREREAVAAEANKLKRRERLARIMDYLRTCEQGTTVDQIAEALDISCRVVRQVVTIAKRKGWLIEATNRSGLIRHGKVTL